MKREGNRCLWDLNYVSGKKRRERRDITMMMLMQLMIEMMLMIMMKRSKKWKKRGKKGNERRDSHPDHHNYDHYEHDLIWGRIKKEQMEGEMRQKENLSSSSPLIPHIFLYTFFLHHHHGCNHHPSALIFVVITILMILWMSWENSPMRLSLCLPHLSLSLFMTKKDGEGSSPSSSCSSSIRDQRKGEERRWTLSIDSVAYI